MGVETRGRIRASIAVSPIVVLGGWLVALGSFSVVCTSLFYVLSPPSAVAPVVTAPAGAMAAAAAGAASMRAAGLCGVLGNLLMAIGAVLLAIECAMSGRARHAAGWAAMVMSIGVFEIVDCLTGFVLSPTAQGGDAVAFEAFRSIFAVFFLVGTASFDIGAVLVLVGIAGGRMVRWLVGIGIVNGVVGTAAVALTFVGLPFSRLVGASVGAGAILFVLVGFAIARGVMAADSAADRPAYPTLPH